MGNDLIALGTEALVSDAWPRDVEFVSLPSQGPGRGGKPSGLTAGSVYEMNQLADAVLAGGGNVFENGALEIDSTALASLRPPLGLLAASSGRVRGHDGRLHPRTDGIPASRVVSLCHRAEPLLVRDAATATFLRELGFEDTQVGGCPSALVDRYIDMPAPDPSLAGTALLSIRHPNLMSIPYADQGRVPGDIRRLYRGLAETHDRAVLLCHDYRDLAFAATIPEASVLYTEDPRQLLSWIAGCAVQIGYRLHGFLAAVATAVPALHISYDERGESMLTTMGLDAFDVPMATSGDVASAALDRLRSLDGRPPRRDAEPALQRFDAVLGAGVATLADRVLSREAVR